MSGSDARALSRSLLDLCRMRKLTIATAESCTGGLVAGALTDIPGSSDVIDRGFVTYSNDAKRAMLGVDAQTLLTFGAVSKETATQMAVGALADGDIGSHFPPSDSQWKGAASDRFLKYAVDRVAARGGRIANLEVTLICERPKIGPLRDSMRARIAEIAGLDISRVAVKATTSERLGFTGREEGIAATASATIRLPWDTKGGSD